MMVTVKGYVIRDDTTIEIPRGAEVLGVDCAEEKGNIALYVKQDDNKKPRPRRFVSFRNGEPIDPAYEPLRFVGKSAHGRIVLHTFEVV